MPDRDLRRRMALTWPIPSIFYERPDLIYDLDESLDARRPYLALEQYIIKKLIFEDFLVADGI
jgi:hypothetical protein